MESRLAISMIGKRRVLASQAPDLNGGKQRNEEGTRVSGAVLDHSANSQSGVRKPPSAQRSAHLFSPPRTPVLNFEESIAATRPYLW